MMEGEMRIWRYAYPNYLYNNYLYNSYLDM
jgi:hypothetical protein